MAIPLKHIARLRRPRRDDLLARPTSWYREFIPSGAGAGVLISCTWEGVAGWARALRLLPDGCVDIVWNGRTLVAIGPACGARRRQLRADGRNVGARLRCGIGASLLGAPGAAMSGKALPLREALGALAKDAEARLARSESTDEQRKLLEDLIAARVDDGWRPDPLTLEAAVRIGSSMARLDKVGADLGLSSRELRRRFAVEIGLGPKKLQRIMRFDRFIRRIPEAAAGRIGMAALAVEAGYSDQAHLCRECVALSGSSPLALARRWLE